MQASQVNHSTPNSIYSSPIAKAVAVATAVIGSVIAVASAIFYAANTGLISLGAVTATLSSFPPILPIALCAIGVVAALASFVFLIIKCQVNRKAKEAFERKTNETLELGKEYAFGTDKIAQDEVKALELFKEAASCGHHKAKLYVAGSLNRGVGCKIDEAQSFKLFKELADEGCPIAMVGISDFYLEGRIVPKDTDHAFSLLKKAADKGEPVGMIALAEVYYNGKICPENDAASIDLYKKAASKGSLKAQVRLGEYYDTPGGESKSEAIKWYKLAAASKATGIEEFTGKPMNDYIEDAVERLESLEKSSKE